MQRLEVSGAVRPVYGLLGVKRLISPDSVQSLLALQQNPAPFCLSIFREEF